MKNRLKVSEICILLLFVFNAVAYSQTAGKISGFVIDETSEPLVGVNVIVRGTSLGAATDMDGEFFILNVPPGTYDVEASMIGYASVRIEGLKVSVNRTVSVDFNLQPSVIQGEAVVVKADRIALKKDQTSSIRNISAEQIKLLPVQSVGEVVSMQPGVVGSHFRGGRNDEVSYLIDGVAVSDAYSHEKKTSTVNPEIVEEVEVITGTFNAEYGNAMSGVVNIVTKEGRNRFEGSTSINYGNYVTTHDNIFEGLSNSDIDRIRDFKTAISGPILKDKLFLVLNARYDKNLGHLNAVHLFNVDDFSDFTSQNVDQFYAEATGDGSFVPFNWSENYSGYGKLTLKPIQPLKISFSLTYNKADGQSYDFWTNDPHQYRFNPKGRPAWHNESWLGMLHLNHFLSKTAFYDLTFSYSDYWTGWYVFENPRDPRYVHDEYRRNNGTWFYTGGQDKDHRNRTEIKANLSLDLTWQVTKKHSLKTGMELNRIELDDTHYTIRNAYEGSGLEQLVYYDPVAQEVIFPYYEPALLPNESVHTDIYLVKPIQAAYYLQDKMEFKMMVVNLGARFDYFDPKNRLPIKLSKSG